jgi:formate dehydrogenase subunit beta
MKTIFPVENGNTLGAVQSFLRLLLESGMVTALYVPLESGGTIIPALVRDPSRLASANPLAPIMPINGARAVSALTGEHAPARLGAVLRPCEIRALIELVKLQQASLEDVVLIGMDCPGTYEMSAYLQRQESGGIDMSTYLAAAQEGREPALEGLTLRQACQMCDQPVPRQVDVRIHLFGVDLRRGIPLEMSPEIAAGLGMEADAETESTGQEAAERLVAAHHQVRENELAAIRARLGSDGGMARLFAACIRCHNCMVACPICYCKTCLFRTAAFDHQPDDYLQAARRKGAYRMLGDSLLFHLTRLNHMSASCVSCGMCTSACPADIPVGAIFSAVGSQVQATFDYMPGRDVAEPLPLITFQANEWTEIGERK